MNLVQIAVGESGACLVICIIILCLIVYHRDLVFRLVFNYSLVKS